MNYLRAVILAIQESKKSNMKYHLGAVLFDSKNFVTGFNRKFSIVQNNREKPFSIHAEEMAILRGLKQNIDFQKATLIIVRVNSQGEFRKAFPCKHCQKLIGYVQIKKVYYTE
jgi:deoxycytidylate deaminase